MILFFLPDISVVITNIHLRVDVFLTHSRFRSQGYQGFSIKSVHLFIDRWKL